MNTIVPSIEVMKTAIQEKVEVKSTILTSLMDVDPAYNCSPSYPIVPKTDPKPSINPKILILVKKVMLFQSTMGKIKSKERK